MWKSKTLAAAVGTAIAALICVDAVGSPDTWNQPIVLRGQYYLYSEAKKDNKPICTERWQFDLDGALTIYSGQEIITGQFHSELKDGDHGPNKDHWLILEYGKTNGSPDCEGKVRRNSVPGEIRYVIWHAMNGGIELCAVEHVASWGNAPALRCVATLYRIGEDGLPVSEGVVRPSNKPNPK